MSATRQGMSFAEIEQIIAQRLTNAIEAIVIYGTKICVAHGSMDQVIRQGAKVAKNANNMRRWGSKQKSNHDQQPPLKRQNVARAYTAGSNKKKVYAGKLPYCNKYSSYLACSQTGTSQSRQHVDNTIRVNQIVTIFLIESSIHILDQNRYPVDISLIRLESRKSPTAELFDVDSGRISIHHLITHALDNILPDLTLLLFSIIPRTSTLSNGVPLTFKFLRRQAAHTKATNQIVESIYWKSFGEEVVQLVIRLDKIQFNRTLFHVLLNEMVADNDVLGS
ncbi:hypothetical protein Tco_1533898 [Tanacetum coccineum]